MRLELTTSAVTGRRSNQLSHWALQISLLLEDYHIFKTTYMLNITESIDHAFLGQALTLLVAVSSMCYHTSTPALSTSSSSRGFTPFGWDISS